MKQAICGFCLMYCGLFCVEVNANGQSSESPVSPLPETLQSLQTRADQIVKRCVVKAKLIREERICESKKNAITACLQEEVKTKDIEKAQQVCERAYIL